MIPSRYYGLMWLVLLSGLLWGLLSGTWEGLVLGVVMGCATGLVVRRFARHSLPPAPPPGMGHYQTHTMRRSDTSTPYLVSAGASKVPPQPPVEPVKAPPATHEGLGSNPGPAKGPRSFYMPDIMSRINELRAMEARYQHDPEMVKRLQNIRAILYKWLAEEKER